MCATSLFKHFSLSFRFYSLGQKWDIETVCRFKGNGKVCAFNNWLHLMHVQCKLWSLLPISLFYFFFFLLLCNFSTENDLIPWNKCKYSCSTFSKLWHNFKINHWIKTTKLKNLFQSFLQETIFEKRKFLIQFQVIECICENPIFHIQTNINFDKLMKHTFLYPLIEFRQTDNDLFVYKVQYYAYILKVCICMRLCHQHVLKFKQENTFCKTIQQLNLFVD